MEESPNEIAESIERLADFLREHNEASWADELDKDAKRVRQDNRHGLDRFLTHFGGMGSLNDVYFHPMNGNCVTGEEAELNERFRALRLDAWEQVREARRL